MNINEIKKDLYKTRAIAFFSHYCYGSLYYNVKVMDKVYQFPISTVEDKYTYDTLDLGGGAYTAKKRKDGLTLSSDLGKTAFSAEMKGSELNRWIAKAVENDDFVCLT